MADDETAFLLTKLAQQHCFGTGIPGSIEAAASAVLGSPGSLVDLAPQVLEVALIAGDFEPITVRMTNALVDEVLQNPLHDESPSAARVLCAYLHRNGQPIPPQLLEISDRETRAGIELAHSIAVLQDRERLLWRVRRALRERPELLRARLEGLLQNIP